MEKDLKNKRILIIVESPNKVKTISSILKNAGYSKAAVMASVGHISTIKNARGSYKNSGIYPEDGFKTNIAVADDKKEVVKKLKEQAKVADLVYIMTDPDREGAQIAWSLIKFLGLKKGEYVRAVTHEITPKAVVAAIENPIPLEETLIEAAQSRMILDKMVGYALSPIARTYLGAKSVGRCQSAGLKLIVDREKEIADFVPERYYDLFLEFSKNGTPFKAKYIGSSTENIARIPNIGMVNRIKSDCDGKDFRVYDISKREKHESPKPPFCTATFQQEVSNKLGLGVKDAMSCAQKLFEGISVKGEHVGLITYHRTDSTEFAPEFLPILKDYISAEFGNAYTSPRQGKKQDADQNGHECLRCVDPSLTPDLAAKYLANDLLVKVYKIIWQRTIAAALPDALISETVYEIRNGQHRFSLTSNELIDAGYRRVYSYKDEDTVDTELMKESFSKNEELKDCGLSETLKQTQPPARYREATFIKELQKRGIGRPSTFASILETVTSASRGYCTLTDKQLMPTEKGVQLSNFLDRAFSGIINLDYTKEMEKSLDLIADGKLRKIDFLNSFYDALETAIKNNTETGPKGDDSKVCPKCGAPMKIRRSRFGKLFYGCSRYPDCNGIINIE